MNIHIAIVKFVISLLKYEVFHRFMHRLASVKTLPDMNDKDVISLSHKYLLSYKDGEYH